jgi:hypothetical protein
MEEFHNKLAKMKNFYCTNCGEMWPTNTEICQTCRKNEKLFTVENDMKPDLDELPPNIKLLFEQLTMVEEMLISPILTVMSIFRLPGGQLLSRGYVANFSQDIQPICKILPRLTNNIPILIVKKQGQNNESKEFKVNKLRIQTLLEYLCKTIAWINKGIILDVNNLNLLPTDGIPTNLNEISDQSPETLDNIIINTGPQILEDQIENDDFLQTTVEQNVDTPFQVDRIQQVITCDWPIAQKKAINEFEYQGLCSMAFPSLFPHCLGDPTIKQRQIHVSETDGYSHLLKYVCKKSTTGEFYYPYVEHPRFKFWAYDRLRRHRALDQSNVYLKQNLGKKH